MSDRAFADFSETFRNERNNGVFPCYSKVAFPLRLLFRQVFPFAVQAPRLVTSSTKTRVLAITNSPSPEELICTSVVIDATRPTE